MKGSAGPLTFNDLKTFSKVVLLIRKLPHNLTLFYPKILQWGYLSGVEVPFERQGLVSRGDYIATFMAWLEEVKAGGGTAFTHPGLEDMLVRTYSISQ